MKAYYQRQTDMADRVLQHAADYQQQLSIPRASFLFTKLGTLATAMRSCGGTQFFGNGGYRAGASERRTLAKELRTVLLDMAATARGLEPEHPGISNHFRLGRQASSHQRLIATARAFLMAAEPAEVKVLFTDRAFPLNFDERLAAKIDAVSEAVGRKASGLQSQKEGTSKMASLSRKITATMRELRALMVTYLRNKDATLLEVWNAAARVYSQPVQHRATSPTAAKREVERMREHVDGISSQSRGDLEIPPSPKGREIELRVERTCQQNPGFHEIVPSPLGGNAGGEEGPNHDHSIHPATFAQPLKRSLEATSTFAGAL